MKGKVTKDMGFACGCLIAAFIIIPFVVLLLILLLLAGAGVFR